MANRARSRSGHRTGPTTDGSSSPIYDLLVVFALVFVLQQLTALLSLGLMAGLFVLTPPLSANPWTIVTSVYAHGSLGHLLSNSLALVVFGWPVARATTRLRFHLFFLVTGAIAGLSQILLTNAAATVPLIGVAGTSGVLGASGAVFALLGYLVASNRLSSGLLSVVEIPQWLAVVIVIALATAVTLATAAPGVALLAHFTGFVLGLVAGRARVLAVARAGV
ncbi:rhomboid family intramembrane serine protease [Natronorubrum sulfidifaciens]|uniref:Rhomboid family protein n=1 Tax=Natronorubrum sulfidifaciens JCM 14089 TaxID=1230460 RepID=L9WE40_9EURY|nr:rhomboid family intramembrane serine protease [Natronorubrum sulfidifaciens]ELY47521.1 rhomboid family protein [Natronorubrum sulfidifaciens JCM 14089]